MLWAGLMFFLASIVIIIRLLVTRNRDRSQDEDPWPGWRHHDGRNAFEALTDPDLLPAVEPDGQMTLAMQLDQPVVAGRPRPRPQPVPHPDPETVYADITSIDLPVISGEVVNEGNWAQRMTVPAPAIVAKPTPPEVAEAWINGSALDRKVRETIERADRIFADAAR